MTFIESILELQHCNTATLQQREQSQARLSYAERQQLSTKSTLQQREQNGACSSYAERQQPRQRQHRNTLITSKTFKKLQKNAI